MILYSSANSLSLTLLRYLLSNFSVPYFGNPVLMRPRHKSSSSSFPFSTNHLTGRVSSHDPPSFFNKDTPLCRLNIMTLLGDGFYFNALLWLILGSHRITHYFGVLLDRLNNWVFKEPRLKIDLLFKLTSLFDVYYVGYRNCRQCIPIIFTWNLLGCLLLRGHNEVSFFFPESALSCIVPMASAVVTHYASTAGSTMFGSFALLASWSSPTTRAPLVSFTTNLLHCRLSSISITAQLTPSTTIQGLLLFMLHNHAC